jgi:regulator of RNase E activity RraA
VRDLGDLPDGFPVVAGSIGPSHAHVHVRDIGGTVTIKGLTVAPGDLVHADRHGALVIAPDIVPLLEDAIAKLLATEMIILEPARADGFDMKALENAWSAFEKARI